MALKDWKKVRKNTWIKGNKKITIFIPNNKNLNVILSVPDKNYAYYPKLKRALLDAKSYMRTH